jgi:hypothetical protein
MKDRRLGLGSLILSTQCVFFPKTFCLVESCIAMQPSPNLRSIRRGFSVSGTDLSDISASALNFLQVYHQVAVVFRAVDPVVNPTMASRTERDDVLWVVRSTIGNPRGMVWLKVRALLASKEQSRIATPLANTLRLEEDVLLYRSSAVTNDAQLKLWRQIQRGNQTRSCTQLGKRSRLWQCRFECATNCGYLWNVIGTEA